MSDEIFVEILDDEEFDEPIVIEVCEQGPAGPVAATGFYGLESSFLRSGGFSVGIVPANSTIKNLQISVQELYNDAAARISVGVDGDPERFLSPDDIHPQRIGEYEFDSDIPIDVDTEIKVFVDSVATEGRGVSSITYFKRS